MKKLLALLLAMVMMFSLAACGTPTGDTTPTGDPSPTSDPSPSAAESQTPAPSPADGPTLSADGRYPAETVKIGFVNYDTTADIVLALQEYFAYLQQTFNFEVIWSESLSSAEEEFAFIEQCAAAGCKAIIGYYNEGRDESVKLTESLGMYYWSEAESETIYEPSKNSMAYLGGYHSGSMQYDFGYACVEMLADAGCKKLIIMSGGKDYGVAHFVQRYEGMMAAVADKGLEVVYEVPGWPGTEEFAAHQTAALETDADGLAGALTALMWLQPMQNAGKFGQIKVAAIETVSEDLAGLFDAGVYVGACSEISGMFGLSIPMILNAVAGYGDLQRNPDGTAPQISTKNWTVNSGEDMLFFAQTERAGGAWTFDADDLKSMMYDFNPDLKLEDFSKLYSAVSADEIRARRAD